MAFLLVFAVGAAIFVTGSELLARYVVAPNDGFERYRNEFRAATAPIAAFGDSQVANAIGGRPDTVNLGYPAETLPLMLFKAEAYARSGHAKAMILQASPQQFAIYRAENAQGGMREQLLADSEPLLRFTKPHVRRYLLAHWRTLLERWVTLAPQAVGSDHPPAVPRSFADWPGAAQRRAAEIRVQLHAPLPAGALTEQLLGQLGESLASLRRQGIAVCIVRYPVSTAYRTAAAALPSFALLVSRLGTLAAAHGATFVDLSDALPDQMLGDPDHVGSDSRSAVTDMVVDRCFDRGLRTS